MGRDKAFVQVGGRALATIAADALRGAGAVEVFAVGGDAAGLAALGLRVVADRRPDEGPLGGLLTALEAATAEVVVVLACDLPRVTDEAVAAVVGGVGQADAAVPVVAGRAQHLLAAWRRETCLASLATAYEMGERAIWRAAASLRVNEVTLRLHAWADDVDDPEALLEIDPPG